MYLGSNEFNDAIENTSGNAPKIRVTLEDGTTLANIKSIKYYGGSNDSDDVSIGTTNMARIDVTAFTDRLLTNNEIFLEQGIELANGVVEYMPIGYFTVQKPQGDIDEVTFTAYDRMQKFEKPYSSSLTYPTTSALILDELCQICGIELATPLDNAIEVTENLKGYTCREVLGYIASMHSSFACIDRYGRLNVRWYSDTPIEKSLKKIWHFEKSQDNFEIAKVEIAKDSETNYVSGDGITTLHNSNPLATQEITDDVFAKLGGFSYSVGEVEMLDDARLDPWDIVSVEYYDGKTYNIPCMTLEHDFKAYSTTVKSVGKSESENEYRFTGPTIQYLNRMATELLVANRVIATKVDAEYVNSHAITTDNLDAIKAEIQTLVVEEIDGKYASIDLANIDVANIGEFYARSGILDEVLIQDGAVTGVLKGVRIVGDVIEANTIKADSLILSGSEESLIYQINVSASGLTAEQLSDEIYKEKLSGTDLVAESVTTNQLAAGCITTSKIQAGAITSNEIAANTITSREINVHDLFAQDIIAEGSLKSIDYDPSILKGMIVDLRNRKIDSYGDDNMATLYGAGNDYSYVVLGGDIIWNSATSMSVGTPHTHIDNGQITINNTVYKASTVEVNGEKVLYFNPGNIYTPKVNTNKVYCNGDIVGTNLVGKTVSDIHGHTLQGLNNAIDTINSNLTEKSISVWTSVTTNPTGISCKMKNNRVVLNGHLVYHNYVAPNEIVTLGTVDSLARPTRATTILVGVLGHDAETQGFTIGTLNVDGTIMVKNTLSISANHFYFDAVWDV